MQQLFDQIMWIFTVPVLKVAIQVGIGLAALFLLIQIIRWAWQSSSPNPFAQDDRHPRKPYVIDQRKRDEVIKQTFNPDVVPQDLDAIMIGSGIGALATGMYLLCTLVPARLELVFFFRCHYGQSWQKSPPS